MADPDVKHWGNLNYQAGKYEAFRDEGNLDAMAEMDLLMCAEPRWPGVKARVQQCIDRVRNDKFCRDLHGSRWGG